MRVEVPSGDGTSTGPDDTRHPLLRALLVPGRYVTLSTRSGDAVTGRVVRAAGEEVVLAQHHLLTPDHADPAGAAREPESEPSEPSSAYWTYAWVDLDDVYAVDVVCTEQEEAALIALTAADEVPAGSPVPAGTSEAGRAVGDSVEEAWPDGTAFYRAPAPPRTTHD